MGTMVGATWVILGRSDVAAVSASGSPHIHPTYGLGMEVAGQPERLGCV